MRIRGIGELVGDRGIYGGSIARWIALFAPHLQCDHRARIEL